MSTSGFGAYALSGESVVVVVGNYEFAAGLTRKAAPSACTKPSHCPRRSQNTPGENGDSREVYGSVAGNRNRGWRRSRDPFMSGRAVLTGTHRQAPCRGPFRSANLASMAGPIRRSVVQARGQRLYLRGCITQVAVPVGM